MSFTRFRTWALPLVLSACLLSHAAAQSPAEAQSQGWDFETNVGLTHWFSAETEDGRAERERERFAVSADTSRPFGRGGRFGFSFDYVRDEDDWSGDYFPVGSALEGQGPYDGIETLSLGLNYQQPLRGAWGVFGRGRIDWGVAHLDGARRAAELSLSDGLSGALAAGASYRFSPALTISFGAFYADRLEDDALIVPIIFVRWQINDHWMLNTANGIFLTYDVYGDQRHLLTASVSYESSDFAHSRATIVDSETGISESAKIYGEEEGFRVGLSYLLNLSRMWGIRTSLAYDFARDLELRAHDQRLGKSELEGTFLVGAAVTARF